MQAIAFKLFEAKAIDRKTLLQMVQVPHLQELLYRLESVIEPLEAQAHKEQQQFELQKARESGNRGRPRKVRGSSNGAGAGPAGG
jgi:hypothetical protein